MQSTTTFPDGKTLTIYFKPDIDPSKIVNDFNQRRTEIQDKDTAIEKLQKKRADAGTPSEAKKITQQIKEWEQIGSYFTINDELILEVGKDWDLKDEATGEPKPFDVLAVKQVHFTRKVKVAEQIIKDLGFDMAELTDPKALSDKSEPQSFSVNTAASSSQVG